MHFEQLLAHSEYSITAAMMTTMMTTMTMIVMT